MALHVLLSLVLLLIHSHCTESSSDVSPNNDMTVRLALLEDELSDLKTVIQDLTELTRNADTKVTQFDTKQIVHFMLMQRLNDRVQKLNDKTTALKTKQDILDEAVDELKKTSDPTTSADVRNMIEHELEQVRNLSVKQEQLETAQQVLSAKQAVLENTAHNNSMLISSVETSIENLKAEDETLNDRIEDVTSELSNVTDVFERDIEQVSERQVVLDNHLNLQSYVVNSLIVSSQNIDEHLAVFEANLSNVESVQNQLDATVKGHHSEFKKYTNSTDAELAIIVINQHRISGSILAQNRSIGENRNATVNNERDIQTAGSTIQGHDNTLKAISVKVASLEAKTKMQTTEIRHLGLQQKVLEQNQEDARTLPSVQQLVWRWSNYYSEYSGELKYLNYNKKHAASSIRVRFTSNAQHYYSGYCHRWYFKFNGNECNNPERIEAVLYKNGGSSYYYIMPIEVTGICYGISAGNVRIALLVGGCTSGHGYSSALYTGWYTSSRITVEEVNVVTH